jgi:hypothetical protein
MSEFNRLVGEMQARLDRLADLTLERLEERFSARVNETAFSSAQVVEFSRASIATQLLAFERGELPGHCPEPDGVAARAAAAVGEIEVLSGGYRAAQMTLWEAWFALVEDSPGLAVKERRELLSRGSDFFFRYADLLGGYVAAVYREEALKLRGNSEQRRFLAVKALLEGSSAAASATGLDLDLEQHHLGLLAWGEAGGRAARELAKALHRPLLIVAPIRDSWWAWISGAQPFGRSEETTIEHFAPPPGASLSLGLQEFGYEGFRVTHRQAQRARLLASAAERSLTRYADVAVEALASENQQEARSFIARELGPIGDDSSASQRIRETLSAYFAAEHNAASAAATLGVHQQTVANRLRVAEERLGHPVGTRRVELEVALRLRAALMSEDS